MPIGLGLYKKMNAMTRFLAARDRIARTSDRPAGKDQACERDEEYRSTAELGNGQGEERRVDEAPAGHREVDELLERVVAHADVVEDSVKTGIIEPLILQTAYYRSEVTSINLCGFALFKFHPLSQSNIPPRPECGQSSPHEAFPPSAAYASTIGGRVSR